MKGRQRRPGPVTERQRAYLAAVVALTEEGHQPSAVEIAARLGVSRTGVRSQLRSLEAQGLLVDVPKVVSSGKWALSDAARALLAHHDGLDDYGDE
jgi:predicted ArsR family transcriptional regulator